MEGKRYKTKQRDRLLQFFRSHSDSCFSVREVIAALAKEGDPIGEATVFRSLPILTEEGHLKRFSDSSGGTVYRYDGGCCSHIHLKCRVCGSLVHLDCSFLEEMTAHFRHVHHFTVDSGQTVLYGICGGCGGLDGKDASSSHTCSQEDTQ